MRRGRVPSALYCVRAMGALLVAFAAATLTVPAEIGALSAYDGASSGPPGRSSVLDEAPKNPLGSTPGPVGPGSPSSPSGPALGDVLSSFASPSSGPFGMAWDGTNLWVADDNTALVYKITRSGVVLSSFAAPCGFPKGLAFDGVNLWSGCDGADSLYQMTPTGTILSRIPTPAGTVRGVTWDGTNLWVADSGTDRVYQVTTTGTVLSSFATPGTDPRGLTFDGTNLWLAENNGDLLYELTTTGTVLSTISAPALSPRGLTFDGTDLWLSDNGTDIVYQLEGPVVATPIPVLSSATNQTFWVGKAPTAVATLTVADTGTAAAITATNDIRVRIPAAFNMTWDALDVTATIGGAAAGKVSSTVTYEDAGKTLVVDVTSDFAVGDTITIADLSFVGFTAASGADNLELEVYNDDAVSATDDKTVQILPAGTPTISSDDDQAFRVGDPPIAISLITVHDDAAAPAITAANDIRIRIPSGFHMRWDQTDVTATILGSGSGKVSSTVSYEGGGRTLVLDVIADFAPGDLITISLLSFANFTNASLDDNLELEVYDDNAVTAYDDKDIFIVQLNPPFAAISSSSPQSFLTGGPPTQTSKIVISNESVLTAISAANDIRVRIPPGIDMTWDVSDVTAKLHGPDKNKVSTTVSYEDGGKTLVLDVTTDFGPDDWFFFDLLSFANFSSASPPSRLELETFNDGTTQGVDDKTREILGTVFNVDVWPGTVVQSRLPGSNYTVDFTLTNTGSGTDSFDLLTSTSPGGVVSVVSMAGAGVIQGANPDSARVTNLAAGDRVIVTVTYDVASVPPSSADTLFFVGRSVASPTQWDVGRLELTVSGDADVEVTKTGPASVLAGDTITYTVEVVNLGPTESASVVITDTLPATGTFVGASNAGDTLTAGVVTWPTIGSMLANDTVTYTVTFVAPMTGTLENIAAASSSTADPDGTNNVDTLTTTVTEQADLQVLKSGPASVAAGDTITYTVEVVNLGPSAAVSVVVTDTLPTTGTYVSASNAGDTLTTGVVTWPVIGTMLANDTVTYTVTFVAPSSGSLTNIAAANSPTGDPDGTNDDGSGAGRVTTVVVLPTISSVANQTFTLGDSPQPIQVITVTEDAAGSSITAANDLRIRVPTGLAMIWDTTQTTATVGGVAAAKVDAAVAYEDGGKTLVLSVISDFAASDQVTIDGLAFASFTAGSGPDNLQLVVAGPGGPTAAADDKTITILTAPTMTLVEGVTPSGTQPPGTDLVYTATFANIGSAAAESLVMTNPIPANTDFKVGSESHDLGTTGLTVVVEYSDDGGSSWTYTPVSAGGGAPAGYDRLVTDVRWTFTGALSEIAPNNTGNTSVTMRIR